jgi:hypothetical protein
MEILEDIEWNHNESLQSFAASGMVATEMIMVNLCDRSEIRVAVVE